MATGVSITPADPDGGKSESKAALYVSAAVTACTVGAAAYLVWKHGGVQAWWSRLSASEGAEGPGDEEEAGELDANGELVLAIVRQLQQLGHDDEEEDADEGDAGDEGANDDDEDVALAPDAGRNWTELLQEGDDEEDDTQIPVSARAEGWVLEGFLSAIACSFELGALHRRCCHCA